MRGGDACWRGEGGSEGFFLVFGFFFLHISLIRVDLGQGPEPVLLKMRNPNSEIAISELGFGFSFGV